VPGENGQFSSAFWVKTKSALTLVIKGGVPAIIPEDLFNRVQERM